MFTNGETPIKRPRHYAEEIQALPVAERKKALESMPKDWRSLVERYLIIAWERRKHEGSNCL